MAVRVRGAWFGHSNNTPAFLLPQKGLLDTIVMLGDLIAPPDVEWEALQ
jgi:hypothetical protein